jgi:hypothetical protein
VKKRSTELKYFEMSRSSFETALMRASIISVLIGKRRVDTRFAWATWVFTRLCVAGVGLSTLANFKQRTTQFKLYTLDHNTIAALARNIIEATLMMHYLTEEGISVREWDLRRTVLYLHDATTRYRMFKDTKKEDAAGFKLQIAKLRREISEHERFAALSPEDQKKLLSGQTLFVEGLRSVARKGGWNIKEFDFVYAYLSSHIHSAPVSFIRTETHGIDFVEPSDHQFGLSAFGLEQATNSLAAASTRILEIFPDIVEAGPDWLSAAKRIRGEP